MNEKRRATDRPDACLRWPLAELEFKEKFPARSNDRKMAAYPASSRPLTWRADLASWLRKRLRLR
jgi:hypothetical protein